MASRFLIIVESPAKSKLIKKYLEKSFPGKSFEVEASFGHVRDLEKKELGVDLETYSVRYVPNGQKREVIEKLKKLAGRCDKVLLASDNDREGEAIAWHLREVLKLRSDQYKRMIFNEITEEAIKNAFLNLKEIDMDLVNAQQTRRIVDRVVGFKLSPLLWGSFRMEHGGTPLSAGRVQSAALKYVVDKEREIEEHTGEAYWSVKGNFILGGRVGKSSKESRASDTHANAHADAHAFEDCKLYNTNDNVIERFDAIKDVRAFLTKLKGEWRIVGSRLHDSKSSPDAPFITSTLQQEASTRLGFSVKMTMGLAQQLYERGLITYMRTDSYAMSEQALGAAGKYITNKYGAAFHERRDYSGKRKVKNGQEAHEAIRPTDFARETLGSVDGRGGDKGEKQRTGKDIKQTGREDNALAKLYELIHKRTVASQMKGAVMSVLDVRIQDTSMIKAKSTCEFRGKLSVVKDPGYLVVYGEKEDANGVAWLTQLSTQVDSMSPTAKELLAKNTWGSAPSRYNEAALIKVLERDGIGRPSTYAGILEKLYQKSYVVVQNTQGVKHDNVDLVWTSGVGKNEVGKNEVGKNIATIKEVKYESITNAEMNRLVPTDVGKRIHEYLAEHFNDIIDKGFTSQMEEQLDHVADGEAEWKGVLRSFWDRLRPRVEAAAKLSVRGKDKEVLATAHEEHIIDGVPYVVRLGKYGPLIEKVIEKGADKAAKTFVGLVPYLKLTKKAYNEVTDDEVKLLVSLPKRLGPGAELKYGRYGFYVVADGENYMLPQKWVREELGGWKNIGMLAAKHIDIIKKLKEEYMKKKANDGVDGVSKDTKDVAKRNVAKQPKASNASNASNASKASKAKAAKPTQSSPSAKAKAKVSTKTKPDKSKYNKNADKK